MTAKHAGHDVVQLAGAGEVVSERLLDHHPAPPARLLLCQAVGAKLVHHRLEQSGRDGQIERVVSTGTPRLVQVGDRVGEIGERFVVADLAGYEANAFGELLPDLLAEGCARVLPHGVVDHLGEVVVMPSTACVSDQGETGRQQPPVRQVVDRRHQLLGRQITRDAEDHQDARSGDPRQSAVVRIAEEVGVAFSHQLTS